MRISSGVAGLDSLVGCGLPAGRLYVLSGPPGSGKTTLSTQFLVEGARQGEDCLFVSMHESRADIVEDMSGYEFGFDRAIGTDRLTFVDVFSSEGKRLFQPPGKHRDASNLINRLAGFIDSNGIDRVVIDSTMLLEYFLADAESNTIQFLTSLKRTDATVALISEMTDSESARAEGGRGGPRGDLGAARRDGVRTRADGRVDSPSRLPALLVGPDEIGPAAGVSDGLDLPSFLRR